MTSAFWDAVYAEKSADQTSWHQVQATMSLHLLERVPGVTPPPHPMHLIDIGAGRSPLASALLARDWDVSLLDCSAIALADAPPTATRIVTDVLTWRPDHRYDVWHDRAVLHFLTNDSDRARYAQIAAQAVAPGGRAIIGSFAPDGPEQCSGLPVRRASAAELAALFRHAFELELDESETHVTPWGAEQHFTWVVLRRT